MSLAKVKTMKKPYREIIERAGYAPTDEFVEALQIEHMKLADTDLVDVVFKRLYRSASTPKEGLRKSAQSSAAPQPENTK